MRRGALPSQELRAKMVALLEQAGLKVDYVELVEAETLIPVAEAKTGCVALIAVYCGKTRLIDNAIL